LVLGLVQSGFRQRVWRDNNTLFAQTVDDAPASYKAHTGYAAVLLQQKRRREALEELKLANALFPADPSAIEYVADAYASYDGCLPAIPIYARILANEPRRARARVGLVACLIALHRHEEARKTIRMGLANGVTRSLMQHFWRMNDSAEASLSSKKPDSVRSR
jgi:tetratricopeptide (TPR) repeat protein